MRKRAILPAAISCLALFAGPARSTDITLCADIWCPYNCTAGSTHPGFAVEIAQEVFGEAGYHVTYQELNWARCIDDARHGRFSGIIGGSRLDAPEFIFPETPIGESGDAYAVRKGDNFRFTDASSLDGRVLGVIRSYNFSGPIGAYIAAHANDASRIEYVSGNGALAKNLGKLVAGRVDVVVDDENVLAHELAAEGLSDRLKITPGVKVTPVFIAFSPLAPQPQRLAHILDTGMAGLRASGRLSQILASYHVPDSYPIQGPH